MVSVQKSVLAVCLFVAQDTAVGMNGRVGVDGERCVETRRRKHSLVSGVWAAGGSMSHAHVNMDLTTVDDDIWHPDIQSIDKARWLLMLSTEWRRPRESTFIAPPKEYC